MGSGGFPRKFVGLLVVAFRFPRDSLLPGKRPSSLPPSLSVGTDLQIARNSVVRSLNTGEEGRRGLTVKVR